VNCLKLQSEQVKMSGAAMAVLARRIVNAGFLIEFIDTIVAYSAHLSSV